MMRLWTSSAGVLVLGAALIGAAVVQAEPNGTDGRPPGGEVSKVAAADTAKPRDPFRPFTLNLRPGRLIPQTPLQHFDLGQLAVVGTVWDTSPPRAMVEDSSGMGYIVGLGTPIGSSGGVVTAIEPQRIIVEERVLDYYGKEQINRIVMETPKEEGPNQAKRERQ
jgi:hypothetical protein